VKPWKVILAAVVLFAAGVLAGATVTSLRAKAAWKERQARREAQSPVTWQRFDFLRRAQRSLELSAEQEARIETHLKESQERFRKLWEPVAPQARAEFDRLRDQIRTELTPEQQAKFDEALSKRSERRRSEGDRDKDRERSREGDGRREKRDDDDR